MKPYTKHDLLMMKQALCSFINAHPTLPNKTIEALMARIDMIDAFLPFTG